MGPICQSQFEKKLRFYSTQKNWSRWVTKLEVIPMAWLNHQPGIVYLLEVFALFSKGSKQSSSSPSDSGESVPSWDVHKEEHEENSHEILETLLAPHMADVELEAPCPCPWQTACCLNLSICLSFINLSIYPSIHLWSISIISIYLSICQNLSYNTYRLALHASMHLMYISMIYII